MFGKQRGRPKKEIVDQTAAVPKEEVKPVEQPSVQEQEEAKQVMFLPLQQELETIIILLSEHNTKFEAKLDELIVLMKKATDNDGRA